MVNTFSTQEKIFALQRLLEKHYTFEEVKQLLKELIYRIQSDKINIADIKQTTSSESDNGDNVLVFQLSDGSTYKYTVKNGSKGEPGEPGAVGPKGDKGDRGEKGDNAVYIGSGDMPDGYNIQIDPEGTCYSYEDIVNEILSKTTNLTLYIDLGTSASSFANLDDFQRVYESM